MRTLITGGAGFIGSHLTELLLQENHEVVVLDLYEPDQAVNLKHLRSNPLLKIVKADIREFHAIAPHFEAIDWVFHLAALVAVVPSMTQPMDYFDVNVSGTYHILEASRQNKIKKILYAASCSCYEPSTTSFLSEKDQINPLSPYALTKYIAEQSILAWAKIYSLPAISLRLFNVYGARSQGGHYASVMTHFSQKKYKSQAGEIFGDGRQTRDFIHVTDVASAFYSAAQNRLNGEVFNVGTGIPTSILQLATLFGIPTFHSPGREGEIMHSCADISKIRTNLSWAPKVAIAEGIQTLNVV